MRLAKSFTIDSEISSYIEKTRDGRSASDRLNEMLRRAMLQEQYERLEAEAAEFYRTTNAKRAGTRSFQKASLRSLGRD